MLEFYNKGFDDVSVTTTATKKKVSFASTASSTLQDNHIPNGSSNHSINNIPNQGPIRSYRCQTNFSQLPNFNNAKIPIPIYNKNDEKRRPDRSLFIFSENGFIRRFCKKIVEKKAFEYFMLLTIAANCVILMINTPLPQQDNSILNKQIEMGDYVFVAIFTIEALLKIIALGFVLSPDAYLKSGWNILDFIVVVVGLVQVLAELNGDGGASSKRDDSEAVRALRAVRVLRPLKLVSGVPSLQVLMKSLIRAMVPLLQILLLVLFVIIIYSIVGLELLRGRYHYTCFINNTNTIATSYYLKPRPCDQDQSWGKLCGPNEICRKATPQEWLGPNNGITTFDNMFLSMLTVFQCITLEGWSEILYLSMDSRDKKYPIITWSAFVLLIIVGSFFMLNLVLGVLSGEFAKERERVENRKSFLKLRKQRQIDRAVEHYLQWITKAEEIIDEDDDDDSSEEVENELKVVTAEDVSKRSRKVTVISSLPSNTALCHSTSNTSFDHAMARKRSRGHHKKIKKMRFYTLFKMEKRFRMGIRRLTKSTTFYWVVLILVFFNTVAMSLYKHNQEDEIAQLLDITEWIFTILFFIEMLIRIYAHGINGYFRSAFNKYDFVIVWLSIADLTYKNITSSHTVGISVLRSVRLLRIFKVTRFWSSMQNVVSSLMNSIRSILSLILLLLLFIFIFALLGMQLFGGQFHSVRIGASRTNFDNFPKAMLAVFQIMTGEDWNSVMYQGITAFDGPTSIKGMLVSLYFVALVIIGNYTLLNVFLAIAVDNLANAQVLTKDEEEEMQLAEEQKKIRNVIYSPQAELKVSKWTKVRSVPKLLAFSSKKNDDDHNPFKGITYKSRPAAMLRAQSEPIERMHQKQSRVEHLQKNGLSAHSKYKSLDSAVSNLTPNNGDDDSGEQNKHAFLSPSYSLVSQGSTGTQQPPQVEEQQPIQLLPRWMRNLEQQQSMVAMNNNTDNASISKPSRRTDLPIGLLPMPNACFDMNHSSKVLRRRQLPATKVLNTRSLFLFSPSSRIRCWCHRLVNLKYFEQFMLFFILLSSACLAIEDPLGKRKELNRILHFCDIGFITIFAFEILVKLIDQGAIFHKGAYLRDCWNVCDTIVVACNIAAVVLTIKEPEGEIQISVAAMRILRVFRSLRVVNKIKSLKVVFQCVVFSLKRVINIIIIAVLVLFMFAVIGCHLFKGKFYYCTDSSKLTKDECQGYFYHYKYPIKNPSNFTVAERKWKNYAFNFDSVPISMLTLFSCGTGEGWPIVMEKSIDATEVDHGPLPDNNMLMSLYHVCFVVIFSFFFLNIFVALIIVTFQEQGEKEITGSELDKNQRACLQFVINAKPRQRFMPKDKTGFSHKVWRVVDSKPFEILIMTLISLNAIVLMLSVDGQSEEYEYILEHVNMVFTYLFTLEAILKLIAYKQNYFRDSWNVFDFCIVFLTLIGAVILLTKDGKTEDFPIDPSFFRLFRAFRLLKLLRQGYNIRILLWTFLQSLRALPYVVLLIAMLFFIYAVIGMLLFSNIKLDERKNIKEYNNFQGFLNALGVLFRCGTGEAWHLVMLDCFDKAKCIDEGNKCGSTIAAVIYFCSFYFFYAFLLLNLFVAVIMDNFDYLTRDESILGPHHMDEFVRVWSEYDPSAAGRIPHEDIYQLMCDMQPPVGFGKKCPRFLAYKRLMKLNMPISGDNTVLFTPTLFALVRTSLGMTHVEKECFRDSSFRKIIKRIWPNITTKTLDVMMPEQTVLSGQQITIGKIYAAKLIYESFKEIKRRKNCTLPQFEMFEATHKRGNSFFRKMMGVLRTSSQPLVSEKEKQRPREEFLHKRRRSNTYIQTNPKNSTAHLDLTERHSNPVRTRSQSNCGITQESFATRLRKTTLPYLPTYTNQTQSMDVIPNSLTTGSSSYLSFSEEGAVAAPSVPSIDIAITKQQEMEERDTKLTDSLITALRDPAKPILCFVNPQIHRENSRSHNDHHGNDYSQNHDNNQDHRSSLPRSRQKRVTVSLPMIQLQIPVESDSDFLDLATSNRTQTLSPDDSNVPDILKSINLSPRSPNNNNNIFNNNNNSFSFTQMTSSDHNSDASSSSSTESEVANTCSDHDKISHPNSPDKDSINTQDNNRQNETNTSSNSAADSNREILLELNNHINKAMHDGMQPHWIYKINENEEDTWC